MAVLTIDADVVDERDRLDYWRSTVCERFIDLVVTPSDGPLAAGRISGADIGTTRVRSIASGPHSFARTEHQIRAADQDYLQIALARRGRTLVVQDGRETTIGPGEFVIYDSSRPFTFVTSDEFEYTICLHPLRDLPLTTPEIRAVTAVRFDGRFGLGAMLPPLLSSLSRAAAADVPLAASESVDRMVGDMFAALVRSRVPAAAPPNVHLERARAFIREHVADTDLTPSAVAAACAISASYLHKLFAEAGTSVSAFIREERLQGAREELTRSSTAGLTVSAIGARWGFPEPPRFSRAFRTRFGCAPSEYRARWAAGCQRSATSAPAGSAVSRYRDGRQS